ncbi:hypothetical protein [Luteibacter rhizovicinus]|uniref:hypothetical protein n=1 Tax=Luteibacter rhizovicinus TaxID=242606 RepID=UPI0015E1A94A|nr:hypothetical protein [Luteibacter rhizovicinus]
MGIAAVVLLLFAGLFSSGIRARPVEPVKLTLCQLLSDPGRYNHDMVEITAYVEHDFENFTMPMEGCPSQQGFGMGLWLEYGGTQKSQTKYCCTNDIGADRNEPLVVEGITCNLVADATFEQFQRLLQQRGPRAVTATVVGRFFAGERMSLNHKVSFWGGYGHMGVFSMVAIERVLAVQPATFRSPDAKPASLSTAPLPPIDPQTVEP